MRVADLERIDDWVPRQLLAALRPIAGDHEIHLVGGALRDRLLGCVAPDLDLVADGRAEQLGRRLARRLEGRFVELAGERFAAYRVVAGDLVIDLWGRGDTAIHEDLERRDLTINSLAVDLATGRLLDPFGGVGDLVGRRLRATSERSFLEDPLRVLRLARFAADLAGFTVDPPTLELARRAANRLASVAAERIREEVERILAAPRRGSGVEILIACGLYPTLWGGADSPPDPSRVAARLADIEPTRDALLAETNPDLGDCDPVAVSQALLFSPPGGGAPAAAASPLLTRRGKRRVGALLELGALPTAETDGRWFLRRWGHRWLEAATFSVLRPSAVTAAETEAVRFLSRLARANGREIFELPTLLDGDEVGRLLGLPPGQRVGQALATLEREQVAGRVKTPDQARDFLARRWSRRRGDREG